MYWDWSLVNPKPQLAIGGSKACYDISPSVQKPAKYSQYLKSSQIFSSPSACDTI